MVSVSTGRDSKQDYGTPPEFKAAVEKRFGGILFDLAASAENTLALDFFSIDDDALQQDWQAVAQRLPIGSTMWLNPPFNKIAPWAEKCARTPLPLDIKLAFLVPASVGSNWFRDHVWEQSDVYFLNGRITFTGETKPFPKDCLLAIYSAHSYHISDVWNWKHTT